MAAEPTPITKNKNASRPRFKMTQFRDIAIESRKMKVGVDIECEQSGEYRPADHRTVAKPEDLPEVVTATEGDAVFVPHPLMLSDKRQEVFEAFQKGKDLDHEDYLDPDTGETKQRKLDDDLIDGRPAPSDTYRMAAAIIGEEELCRHLAGGGHSNDIALAWQYLTADQADDLSGPKAPTPRR